MKVNDEDIEAHLQRAFAILVHELHNVDGEVVEWQLQGRYPMLQPFQLRQEHPLKFDELVGRLHLRSALVHQRLIYL